MLAEHDSRGDHPEWLPLLTFVLSDRDIPLAMTIKFVPITESGIRNVD
jgi:hypothetical protein